MKKYIFIILIAVLYSCSSTKTTAEKPLYQILTVNDDGGANIKFYEILTEPKEIKMLMGDEKLAKLIKSDDINSSSFLVLNTGPTSENANKIKIEKVVETATQIEIYVKDDQTNLDRVEINDETKYPYTVVKVNSKKTIVIK